MQENELNTSGIESSDVDNPDRDTLLPFDVYPSKCHIGEIIPIVIILEQDNELRLTERNCEVKFIGKQSKKQETQRGYRAGNDYAIRLETPLWQTAEKVLLEVGTQRHSRWTVLGRGDFTFLPKPNDPSVSVLVNMVPDESSKRLLAALERGAEFKSTSGPRSAYGQRGGSSSPPTNTCTVLFYLAYGEASITKLVERIITYAVNNGLPEGVSLLQLFGNLPQLDKTLASCHFSNGSLQGLIKHVQENTSPGSLVREQIESLVQMSQSPVADCCNCEQDDGDDDAGYVDTTIPEGVIVSHDQSPPEDIVPDETGLRLPRHLNMSSKTGMSILLRHKRGEITENKAIEESRDYVYGKTSRQQLTTVRKIQGNRTKRGQDMSDTTSISSTEEGRGTRTRRPCLKKSPKTREEQQMIRSRLETSGSTTSEYSTTSQTNSTNLASGDHLCNSNLSSSVFTNRGGGQIPLNERSQSKTSGSRYLTPQSSSDSGIASPPTKHKMGRFFLQSSPTTS
jgi:hypothetical protein